MSTSTTYNATVVQASSSRTVQSFIERQVPDVPEPAWTKPTDEEFFLHDPITNVTRPNTYYLKEHFFHEGRLTESQALHILKDATSILAKEPNLLEIYGAITVCGDVHGQYYDLIKLFAVGGSLPDARYLFLGDYVDRGFFGIECFLYLLSLKIAYPDRLYLLRGNHESRHLTGFFTFHRECLRKYSSMVYEACILAFNALPLAAVLDGRFFCVHAGISPHLNEVAEINEIDRFQEPPQEGLMCDLLWSDPAPDALSQNQPDGHYEYAPEPSPGTTFYHNHVRGTSYLYTYEAVCNFLDRNRLLSIIRAHEAQLEGYQMQKATLTKNFPSVITIFSAPNYCDTYNNRAAILKYFNRNITIRQFRHSRHPFWLENFMDAFTWSLPFVALKVTEMLVAMLSVVTREELAEEENEDLMLDQSEEAVKQRRAKIRAKILAVGKMQRMFKLMREETEHASEFRMDVPDTEDTHLGARSIQLRRTIHGFDEARRSDLYNERMPAFHEPTNNLELARVSHYFPDIQAPSTRSASRNASAAASVAGSDVEDSMRRVFSDEDDVDDEIEQLADRLARIQRPLKYRRVRTGQRSPDVPPV